MSRWFNPQQRILLADDSEGLTSEKPDVNHVEVKSVVIGDQGWYTCVVENEAGRKRMAVEVIVTGEEGVWEIEGLGVFVGFGKLVV